MCRSLLMGWNGTGADLSLTRECPIDTGRKELKFLQQTAAQYPAHPGHTAQSIDASWTSTLILRCQSLSVHKQDVSREPKNSSDLAPRGPKINPRSEVWVATVRYDKNRICQPKMRFSPEIKVAL